MARPGGEREIIARIRQATGNSDDLVVGIGDDCAVYRTSQGRVSLVTTDTMVAGVHFDTAWHPPVALGRKAASVNISDIAAMGGFPRFALLSLALPPETENQWLSDFMAGFLAVLSEHGVVLIGGDTVQSGHESMFSVTLLGEMAETELLTRKGARIGDVVLVSGLLGEAAAGLALCRMGLAHDPGWQTLVGAHLDPVPQVALGRVLAASGLVHAMQDLSDGLATDLAHICAESGVGAVVAAERIPLSPVLCKAGETCGHSPLDWALSGGEDYQLLFTVGEQEMEPLCNLIMEKTGRELFAVGRIVEGRGVFLEEAGQRREISYRGYEHFR
ncbi:thiamine-phosphate kinase [Thiovibrio frasassiensis]|uniref:Thiamine-monophosphate kinase n=1 Tax=Thiovibrio frasassiensis TaxID=2984131 RepID=A0A9X4RKJ6_9BACT|nr:thiamine-phosphate kinase [Thiovibrio frasassiensis]MDG4474590.1 thiamine-phosphate kinase [Thiovibrio frasassiensis]